MHGAPFVRKVVIALDFNNISDEIVALKPFSGEKEYLRIKAQCLA